MRFNPDNFLYLIKQLVTGANILKTGSIGSSSASDGGIKVDKAIPLATVSLTSASLPAITDSTTGTASTTFGAIAGTTYATDAPAIKNALAQIALELNALHNAVALTSSAASIVVPTATNAIGTISFPIPRDYDEASDHLFIRLAALDAAGDASITITGTPTVYAIATGTSTTGAAVTATAPFSSTALDLTASEQVFEINLSGNGLKRDDTVTVALALVGTTTGATSVFFVEYSYDSTIVSYNETDAIDAPGGTLPGFGNPLR